MIRFLYLLDANALRIVDARYRVGQGVPSSVLEHLPDSRDQGRVDGKPRKQRAVYVQPRPPGSARRLARSGPHLDVMCHTLRDMAVGKSRRIVIDVDDIDLKRQLHSALAGEGRCLKDWFLEAAQRYLSGRPLTTSALNAGHTAEASAGSKGRP